MYSPSGFFQLIPSPNQVISLAKPYNPNLLTANDTLYLNLKHRFVNNGDR